MVTDSPSRSGLFEYYSTKLAPKMAQGSPVDKCGPSMDGSKVVHIKMGSTKQQREPSQANKNLIVTGCADSSWNGDYVPATNSLSTGSAGHWMQDAEHEIYRDDKWRLANYGVAVYSLETTANAPAAHPQDATFQHGCVVTQAATGHKVCFTPVPT